MNKLVSNSMLLFLAFFFFVSCKKGNPNVESTQIVNDTIYTISNPNLANVKDTLAAFQIFKESGIVVSYYGDMDDSGNPLTLNSVKIKNGSDTVLNLILNNAYLTKTAYYTVKGVRDSLVMLFTYTDTTVTLSTAIFDWLNRTHKIKSQTTMRRDDKTVLHSQVYQKWAFANNLVATQAGLLLAANIGVAVALACPPCIIPGVALGLILTKITDNHKTFGDPNQNPPTRTVETPQEADCPDNLDSPSPQNDLSDTELGDNTIEYGTSNQGAGINVSPACSAVLRITNLVFEVSLNADCTSLNSALVRFTPHHFWNNPNCNYFDGEVSYASLTTYTLNGPNLTINFGSTSNGVTFTGTVDRTSITGNIHYEGIFNYNNVPTHESLDCPVIISKVN